MTTSEERVVTVTIHNRRAEWTEVYRSDASAYAALARYARENWGSVVGLEDIPDVPPDDDTETIVLYFETMAGDGEWFQVDSAPIQQ